MSESISPLSSGFKSEQTLPFIECHSLRSFLSLTRHLPMFLAQRERTVYHAPSQTWQREAAIVLTGQNTARSVVYGTFVAAKVTGKGTAGSLTYPITMSDPSIPPGDVMKVLVDELQGCLLTTIQAELKTMPLIEASYKVPDAYLWSVQSEALTSGIRFEDGHWIASASGSLTI